MTWPSAGAARDDRRGELLRAVRQLLGLDEAVTRLACDEARMREQRPVEPESEGTPPISNSPSARSMLRRALSRSSSYTISFAIIGS